MIRLDVEDYCEKCQCFEAKIIKMLDGMGCNFKVKCANAEKCRAIAHYIRDHMEEENKDAEF